MVTCRINIDSLGERADMPGFVDGLIVAYKTAWGDDVTVEIGEFASTTEDLDLYPTGLRVFEAYCREYDNGLLV